MSDQNDAILTYMKLQHLMTKTFLSALLVRLQRDVPEFDAEMFLEHLYITQSNLPNSDQDVPADQAALGNALWREFVEMTEQAIKDAKAIGE